MKSACTFQNLKNSQAFYHPVLKLTSMANLGKRKKGAAASTKVVVAKVQELAQECLESRGKLNNIVTLLEHCEDENDEIAYTAFVSMGHVYGKLLERGDMKKQKSSAAVPVGDVKSKIASWLRENRTVYVQVAYRFLANPEAAMQVAAYEALLKVVNDESQQANDFHFNTFYPVVENLVSVETISDELLNAVVLSLNNFTDVRYFFYKCITKLSTSNVQTEQSATKNSQKKRKRQSVAADNLSTIISNIHSILFRINDPSDSADELDSFLYSSATARSRPTLLNPKEHRRAFSECWLAYLRLPMSAEMHKRILLVIHKKIIPFLMRPTLLISFLVDSYDQGGAVSLLALNGLFTLITEHNLDYPDFYTKLYALFDKNVLHVKYRSRFLRLVDLFLSSSKLPSYLVAAFIKKMARLALHAPPAAIVIVVPFIYNLLKKHTACLVMIHREQQEEEGLPTGGELHDPYLPNETNPADSKALESSLWELQTLKQHYLHSISGLVRVYEQPLGRQGEYDLEDFLDHTYGTLFESELKKPITEDPALSLQRTTSPLFETSNPILKNVTIF
ncbi:CBF/Mak21 family-domain-containing protein [Phlyctochytrium arcticum]|nr:CBF/Mak21 family-domain-containing protein [Phlyctochytrium arcticum]